MGTNKQTGLIQKDKIEILLARRRTVVDPGVAISSGLVGATSSFKKMVHSFSMQLDVAMLLSGQVVMMVNNGFYQHWLHLFLDKKGLGQDFSYF